MEVSPGRRQKVTLPFPYHHVSPEERPNLAVVLERRHLLLSDDSPAFAIVGTLQPCIFVGLRNEENGKAVIFHKHFSNSVDSLIEIAKAELSVKDPQNLKGFLFTNDCKPYESIRNTLYNGESQMDTLKRIRGRIIEAFGIPDAMKIKMWKFVTPLADWALGDYELAELSVSVDSRLNMRSICLMHENIFEDLSAVPFYQTRLRIFNQIYQARLQQSFLDHFPGQEEAINSYEVLPFRRV